MDIYTTEEQQTAAIKNWWRQHGLTLVVGLALGVSAVFGWRYRQGVVLEQAAAASGRYADMITLLREEKRDQAREEAAAVLAEYERTAYGVFAMLVLAKLAVEDDDLEAAETHLRRALDSTGAGPLGHVIRLRLVRTLIAREKLDEAQELADPGRDQGEFAPSYAELLGDISMLRGDAKTARDSYQQSIEAARAAGRDVSTLELKIDNIGES